MSRTADLLQTIPKPNADGVYSEALCIAWPDIILAVAADIQAIKVGFPDDDLSRQVAASLDQVAASLVETLGQTSLSHTCAAIVRETQDLH